MARRRKAVVVSSEELPGALLSIDAPEWRSHRAARSWCQEQGFEMRLVLPWWSAPSLHREAVHRWAEANFWMSERYPKIPDWKRLREAGVPAPSRARDDWLSQVRVE